MLITDLPAETLDQIAAALDSPLDLANLGAVCSQLHLVIVPYHTQFRVIRTPIISPLWQKLAENRSLAQNVRVLEIQSSEVHGHSEDATLDKPVTPAIYAEWEAPRVFLVDNFDPYENDEDDSDNEDAAATLRVHNAAKNAADLDAERSLVSALKGMSGLVSFRWTRTPPLINPDNEDDIWMSLAKYCRNLTSIDVLDREKPYDEVLEEADDPAYQRPTRNPNFYLFQNLKSFSLQTEAFNVGNFTVPDFEQGKKMLVENCPDLEVLSIRFVLYANPHSKTVPAAPLFSSRTWASLREISLCGFEVNSTELSSFLVSHPTIEVLSFTSCPIHGSLCLQPGILPNLKRLSADASVTYGVLDSTSPLPRPLESITGTFLDDVFLNKLEQSGTGPTLKKLSTSCNDSANLDYLITRLSRLAPNLEWMYLHRADILPIARTLYPVFGQLAHLHTLLGVRFLDSRCEPASENTKAMKALTTACPKLRRLDWYSGVMFDDSLGIVIERNGRQVSWCIRNMIRRYTEGSVYTGWGERGCGSFQV